MHDHGHHRRRPPSPRWRGGDAEDAWHQRGRRRPTAPPWWPDGEPWPPRRGPAGQEWATFGRRVGRTVFIALLLLLSVPIALGLLIASALAGTDGLLSVIAVWVVVGAVLAGAAMVLWRTWAPIQQLIAAAGRLADGDHSARVTGDHPVLMRPVVSSFNRMATRLQAADEQRRRLLADVGHELRTPLTVVRGELEAMIDGVRPVDEEHLARVLDDVAVVEHLLDDLRTLSLAESGALVLHREPTDVGALARDVADRFARVAAEAGVALELDGGEALPLIEVDPMRIQQVVSNLLVNAIGATPPGGTVTIAARDEGAVVVLDVRDTGVGIPPDDAGLVFERFHKGSGSSGSGLGLTISRDLIVAHGGVLDIADTSPQGTTVRVSLPRP